MAFREVRRLLHPDEVHLWSLMVGSIPDDEQEPAQRDILSRVERERMERFRSPVDRRMYGVSHVLLRKVLARYVGEAPERLEFSRGKKGKPALVRGEDSIGVGFNLTHTRGLAAVAVSATRAVGVDAERGDRSIGEMLASRIFSEEEQRDLVAMPPEKRARGMIRLWTLKEAYVKALGVGVSLSIAEIQFRIEEDGTPRFLPDPSRWRFFEVEDVNPFVVSVAVEIEDRRPVALRFFDGAALIREN